jgi:cysteinyl-tRNA synthetase
MDIERLMQDLTIEQLEDIQTSLRFALLSVIYNSPYFFSKEVEKKKEDLRQMVGRRYRDVLQAANAVKRLTEISQNIVDELHTLKSSVSLIEHHSQSKPEISSTKKLAAQRFILLNSIMPLVSSHLLMFG